MKSHLDWHCGMKLLNCKECKQNVLRKDFYSHLNEDCPEHEILCQYASIGCNVKIKRKYMEKHLKDAEVAHLKLKVRALLIEREKIQIELNKVKVQNQSKNKQIDFLSKKLNEIQIEPDIERLLLFTTSKRAYLCDIKTKKKEAIQAISPFSSKWFALYCIHRDVGFCDARKIGFDTNDIDLMNNKIVFGINDDQISALCLNTNKCISFDGNIPFKCYHAIFTHSAGLLLVGGKQRQNEEIPNYKIWSIQFDQDKFSQNVLTNMPYSAANPSVITINENNKEKLFICGGWWNKQNLNKCSLYDFETKQWKNFKNMNNEYQAAGICEWRERGNKIIVAGGYQSDNNEVEEYDMHKNEWIDLPQLNKKHDNYPALFTSNNILFCVGRVAWTNDPSLGEIEMYDPRDRANRWIPVDSVENYFKLPKDAGAGFNCFLPL